jgi:hypothetical protein
MALVFKGSMKTLSTTYIEVESLAHGFFYKRNCNISKFWQLSKQSIKIIERILINESKVWFISNGLFIFYHSRCLKAQFFTVKVFKFF